MEKTQLLKDPNIEPTRKVISEALGNGCLVYTKFIEYIIEYDILVEWRYYNDGKAWLAKAQAKKKTVCWLSVWEGFFMVSFFFTEKTKGGIQELIVSTEIKEKAANASAVGKLIPLIFEVKEESQLQDIFTVMEYKRNLK